MHIISRTQPSATLDIFRLFHRQNKQKFAKVAFFLDVSCYGFALWITESPNGSYPVPLVLPQPHFVPFSHVLPPSPLRGTGAGVTFSYTRAVLEKNTNRHSCTCQNAPELTLKSNALAHAPPPLFLRCKGQKPPL